MSRDNPKPAPFRPELSTELLIFLGSVAFATAYNRALWHNLFGATGFLEPRTLGLLLALLTVVICVQFAGLALLLTRRTVRPVLAVLFVCTALASFYMDRYTIFLNTEMLRNILKTDPAEAGELLSVQLVPHMLLYAAVPIVMLLWTRIRVRPLRRAILIRIGAVTLALVIAVLARSWVAGDRS